MSFIRALHYCSAVLHWRRAEAKIMCIKLKQACTKTNLKGKCSVTQSTFFSGTIDLISNSPQCNYSKTMSAIQCRNIGGQKKLRFTLQHNLKGYDLWGFHWGRWFARREEKWIFSWVRWKKWFLTRIQRGHGGMRHPTHPIFSPQPAAKGHWTGVRLAEGLCHMSNMGDKAAVEL